MLYSHRSIDPVRCIPRNVCGIRACAYGRVRTLHGTSKTGTYCGKVRVRLSVPSMCARKRASLGATCVGEPALLTLPMQVHVIVRVSVGFSLMRALKHFVQFASAVSSCPCSVLVWDQYGSWAGACDNETTCSVLVCGNVYRGAHVRESVPQHGPRPPGLCTSVYVCIERTRKGFIQCADARPPGLYTSVYVSTVRA